jgi:uncharacterized protein (DUF488 family)
MLNRQKVLIYLLRVADRPVSRTELVKWCFVLRSECASRGGSAFYDFVPYMYGPFSFLLYHDAVKLVERNYLCEVGDNAWSLNHELAQSVDAPEPRLARDIEQLLARFLRKDTASLIRYVYERHPAYTVNSKLRKLDARPESKSAVFTAGYEGLSIDAFLNLLVASGVKRLIDVRNHPVSRRYGFHKSTLQRLTGRLEIDYVHFPELGIPSELRCNLTNQQSYDVLFAQYERTVLNSEGHRLRKVASLMTESPSVLVCMESEPKSCHRSRLALAVAREAMLPVVHLRATT